MTRHRDRRSTRDVIAVAGVLLALAGCGSAHRAQPRTLLFVVPHGAAVSIARGERVDIMPARLELHVGDVVRIRNDDTLPQTVGPYEPRSQIEVRYGSPGQFVGTCSFTRTGRYEIIVRA